MVILLYSSPYHHTENADGTVRSKYDQHIRMMILLCKPAEELAQQIPKPTKQAAIATGSTVFPRYCKVIGIVMVAMVTGSF